MLKKCIVLAGAAGIVGLMAFGCSSTTTTVTDDGGTTDGGKKDVTVPDSGDTDSATASCAGSAPSSYPWQLPEAPQDVCSDADITAVDGATQNAQSIDDLKAAISSSTACQACLFGSKNDASNWKAIFPLDEPGLFLNRGGCAVIAGASEKCAKKIQEQADCPVEACAQCATQDDYTACRDEVLATDGSGACKDTLLQQTDCTQAELNLANTACAGTDSFKKLMTQFCHNPSAGDAASD